MSTVRSAHQGSSLANRAGFLPRVEKPIYNFRMHLVWVRRVIGVVLLCLSAVLLLWSLLPAGRIVQEFPLQATPPASPEQGAVDGLLALQVSTPKRLRSGETQAVGLAVDLPGVAAAPAMLIFSRLDLPGVEVAPGGEFTQALAPGQPVQFTWKIRARQPGSYSGTLWLYSAELAADSQEPLERQLLLAQPVQLAATSLLGLSSSAAQVIGMVSGVVGLAVLAEVSIAGAARRAECQEKQTRPPG